MSSVHFKISLLILWGGYTKIANSVAVKDFPYYFSSGLVALLGFNVTGSNGTTAQLKHIPFVYHYPLFSFIYSQKI